MDGLAMYDNPTRGSPQARKRAVIREPANIPDATLAEKYDLPEEVVAQVRMIARMHAQDMSLSVMSNNLHNLSRERIRQLVVELGLKPRLQVIQERNAAIMAEPDDADDEELGAKYGISAAMVGLVRRSNGVSVSADRKRRLEAAIEDVDKRGVSIRQAAMKHDIAPGTLSRHLKERDIGSRHGRWGALEHRRELIPKLIAEGKTRREIVEAVEAVELKSVKYETLNVWAKENLGFLLP